MTLAYIVPTSPVSSFIFNELIEVQKAGHRVIVIPLRGERRERLPGRTTTSFTTLPARLFTSKIILLALYVLAVRPVRVLRVVLSLHKAAGLNPYAHLGVMAVLPKSLAVALWAKRIRAERIHAHFASHTATCAAIASAITGIPFSFTAHAYDIYCATPRLRNATLDWKLRNAAQVFVISEYGARLLRARLPMSRRNRLHVVYVGIPLTLFRVQPWPSDTGGIRLLCIASFARKKGLDTLLEACATLKAKSIPFHLRLYGNGPLGSLLKDMVVGLGLSQHVELAKPILQEEVARAMASCHVFVMPCRIDAHTGDMDGIPTVFMEAMAVGRPVISCPISGIPELVRDGETGLLVPPDDPVALAKAIARLASDEDLRNRLGGQARATVERQHDQRLNSNQLLELMDAPSAGKHDRATGGNSSCLSSS